MKKKTQHWKKAKSVGTGLVGKNAKKVVHDEVHDRKLPPFPPRIFVKWEDNVPLNDPYLAAQETIEGFEEDDRVAVYELVETHMLKVTRQLTRAE